MNKHEKKYQNTDEKILNALMELLESQDFLDITVSALCRKAEINRTTFYAHYNSTADAVLKLEERLIADFIAQAQVSIPRDPRKTMSNLLGRDVLLPYLDYVSLHRKEYMLYNSLSVFHRKEHMELLLNAVFVPRYAAYGVTDLNEITFMAEYYLSGINAILCRWIDHDCAEPAETIYRLICRCATGIRTSEPETDKC